MTWHMQRLLESQVAWLAGVASSSLKDPARKVYGRQVNGVALRAGLDLLPSEQFSESLECEAVHDYRPRVPR
jgi:hypothetical protein